MSVYGVDKMVRRSPRWRRIALVVVVVLAVVLVGGTLGGGWYGSGVMLDSVHPTGGDHAERVLGVRTTSGGKVVVLASSAATVRPGAWGLVWDGGAAMLGDIVGQAPGRVERELLSGTAPPTGQPVSVTSTYQGDPKTSLGLDFTEIAVSTELGDAPAWYIPAADPAATTWAIMVHGSNGRRQATLHAIPAMHRFGLPVLDITYRNDLGAPASPDGLIHLGASEWRDVESAVRTAQGRGARRVVLFGESMGGAVVGQFLGHSRLADVVAAVVLENPLLSAPRTGDYQVGLMHMPSVMARAADLVAGWRAGIDVSRIDLLDHPPRVKPPALVLQGDADVEVPVQTSRDFAAAGARLGWAIQYVEFPGAGHTQEWNTDRARYESSLSGFLARVLGPGQHAEPTTS
ncbi:prolyl oligopeptidase family serine peptidase [Nonomuraea sp. NPDC026600]|uniref:alpha/beta hydrolase family protein n=1 Tax=Nonomuraea sp. NPDC026600 TaxID=3155363 RepID=UPI0033E9CD13